MASIEHMRLVLFFFCLIGSVAAIAQLPEGHYISLFPSEEHATEITIRRGNRFTYTQSYHMQGRHGSGAYTIKKNKLILQFENPDSLSAQPVTHTRAAEGDSVIIHLHLYNPIDTTPFPNATVWEKEYRIGTRSDTMGNATVKFLSSQLPVELEISVIGARTTKMIISEKGIHSISYPMSFFHSLVPYGTRKEFIIKPNNNGELRLKEKGRKYYLIYRRIN